LLLILVINNNTAFKIIVVINILLNTEAFVIWVHQRSLYFGRLKDNQLSPLPKTNKPIALMILLLLMMLYSIMLMAYTSLTKPL